MVVFALQVTTVLMVRLFLKRVHPVHSILKLEQSHCWIAQVVRLVFSVVDSGTASQVVYVKLDIIVLEELILPNSLKPYLATFQLVALVT